MRVVKVVVKVAAVAIESVKVPVKSQLAASVLYKLRSQVLENHIIPQECMNNILPLNSFNSSLKVIQYLMFLFSCSIMTFVIGVPVFLILMTSLKLIVYVFELCVPNCER